MYGGQPGVQYPCCQPQTARQPAPASCQHKTPHSTLSIQIATTHSILSSKSLLVPSSLSTMEIPRSAPNDTSPPFPSVGPPERPRNETHRALFDFVGHNQYEVTMKKGDLFLVTEGDRHGMSLFPIHRKPQLTNLRLESCQNRSRHRLGTFCLPRSLSRTTLL